MRRLLLTICLALMINHTYAQADRHELPINSSMNINNGQCDYSTTFVYKLQDAGYGNSPTSIKFGFINSYITEITYKGYKASELLDDVSFPVKTKLQADVSGTVIIQQNRATISTNFQVGWVSDGSIIDAYDFPDGFRERIFSTFGKDVTCNDVTPKITYVTMTNLSINYRDITNKMSQKLREIKAKEDKEKRIAQQKAKEEREEAEKEREEKTTTNNSYSNSSYSSSSSYSHNSYSSGESVYQKRQREANEAAARKRRHQQEQLDRLEQQRINNQRKIDQIDQIGNDIHNIIDAYSAGSGNTKHTSAIEENNRHMAEIAERERRKAIHRRETEARRRREAAERRRRERIRSAQNDFFENITDHKMPLVAKKNEAYFFIVIANKSNKAVQFAPFSLMADNSKKLPFKNRVIADFTKKHNNKQPQLYGPYYTKKEQLTAINDLKYQAGNIEINVDRDIIYNYEQKNINQKNDAGFWGDKKSTKSASKSSTFWD